MNRISTWYHREQPFSRVTAVLSVTLVMVALLLTAMVTWGDDSIPVVFAFGAVIGFGAAATGYLALTIRAWRERSRSRSRRTQ